MNFVGLIAFAIAVCLSTNVVMSASLYVYDFKIKFNESDVDVQKDVHFYLYTRENPEEPQELLFESKESLKQSSYNSSKHTKFMTHGWLNTYKGKNCETVRRAFLANDDFNVIVVDWGEIAKLPYLESASLVKAVALCIAKMINFLEDQNTDLRHMTIVGHSLGAQVMGLAGYQTRNKVGHVVGLDPARPGFEGLGPGSMISTSDATLVEIIHTNAGNMGLVDPAGHIDFYPNGGGLTQPGCGIDANQYCAHDRAYIYYAEALTRPDGLLAVRCSNYEEFLKNKCDKEPILFAGSTGLNKKGKGSYFLRTAEEAPFGLGLNGTKGV